MAVLVPVGRYEQFQRERRERFKILDQTKAKTRRIPAKRLDGMIDEAVRASRAHR
jgi:hypothetical protein